MIDVVVDAFNDKKDIGDLKVLRRYERWRRSENRAMIAAMDGLKRLFGSELSSVKNLRSVGLSAVNKITPLKNIIMRQAMGLSNK